MTKRDYVIILLTMAFMGIFGSAPWVPSNSNGQQVTTGPPVVQNGTLDDTHPQTIIPGTGRGYIVYTFTNESHLNGIRCEYGGTAGEPPARPPTTRTGSLIAPGVSITERTAPSNRLECIAVSGLPEWDITLYPK